MSKQLFFNAAREQYVAGFVQNAIAYTKDPKEALVFPHTGAAMLWYDRHVGRHVSATERPNLELVARQPARHPIGEIDQVQLGDLLADLEGRLAAARTALDLHEDYELLHAVAHSFANAARRFDTEVTKRFR